MPESMRKDVEKSLQELPPGRKKPERYTRKARAELANNAPDSEPAASSSASVAKTSAPEEDEVCFVSQQHKLSVHVDLAT